MLPFFHFAFNCGEILLELASWHGDRILEEKKEERRKRNEKRETRNETEIADAEAEAGADAEADVEVMVQLARHLQWANDGSSTRVDQMGGLPCMMVI